MMDAIFFDMDGTLLLSETIGKDTYIDTCVNFGHNPPVEHVEHFDSMWRNDSSLDAFHHFISDNFRTLSCPTSADEFIRLFYEIYELNLRDSKPLPGAVETINLLKKHTQLGLVTGSTRKQVEIVSNQLGGLDNFSTIVTYDDTNFDKPHPEPYLIALERLNTSANGCFAVENSTVGIKSALDAGLVVLAIQEGNPTPQDHSLAHFSFNTFHEASKFLLVKLG